MNDVLFQVGAELVFRVLGCKSKRITVTYKKTLVSLLMIVDLTLLHCFIFLDVSSFVGEEPYNCSNYFPLMIYVIKCISFLLSSLLLFSPADSGFLFLHFFLFISG